MSHLSEYDIGEARGKLFWFLSAFSAPNMTNFAQNECSSV